MIRMESITKLYKTKEIETAALKEVSLDIRKGEFVAVMGPSGCGKSTLLNVLGMLDSPSSGKYWFSDQEVSSYSERRRTNIRKINIGIVFQSFNLIDELTVYQNIELPLVYLGMRGSKRKNLVRDMLERMNIAPRANHYPLQLSGGQQQRVAVARAVIANPKLLLADEPTGNLDSEHGKEVMNIITELNDTGTTVVMVTHSPTHAAYSHRIVNLFDGKIITENIQDGKRTYAQENRFF